MSLYGTIYTSTSGLLTYSKGLDVISNNVANLNSPGFKRSDLLFRDLFYQYQMTGEANQEYSSRRNGNGVTENGTTTSFSQGDIQQSGNATDVAIDGNGFFILRNDGNIQYSRLGQFLINQEGYLVSAVNNARVAGLSDQGELTDININQFRVSPAKATTEVVFVNNLSTGSTQHEIEDIVVYDSVGNRHELTLTLTNNNATSPRSWLAEVRDSAGEIVVEDLEIRFQTNGSPLENYNKFTFSLPSEGGVTSEITFNFGDPGTFSGATSFASGTTSNLAAGGQDGYTFGSQTNVTFNSDGILEISYSNGDVIEAGRIALAWLNDLQRMNQIGGGLFEYSGNGRITIGTANDGQMGRIVAESVEISNVELSQEFTDLVIVQRGFQVSSQVLTIANEMIQQLIDSAGSR